MSGALRALVLLLVSLAAFLWVGAAVTSLTGGERRITTGEVEISPEGGETIFWGKGRCFTCHSIGDQGSAVRGPNLGQFGSKFPSPIGARAQERANERSQQTGQEYTAIDYLVESLAKPDAYLVEGYKNEMAVVYAPPISLSLKEIKAVIAYLQSQGGDYDGEIFESLSELAAAYFERILAATAAGGGDPGNGEEMFAYNCADCHTVNEIGGDVGPDLSNISGKGLDFLAESILRPAQRITEGYETFVVVEHDGRKTTGIKSRETAEVVEITKANGEVVTISRSDIAEITEDELSSLMPADLTEALTVKDYQDVLAYMMMLKGDGQ